MSGDSPRRSWRKVVLWLIFLGSVAMLLLFGWLRWEERQHFKKLESKAMLVSLTAALKFYSTEYGFSVDGDPAHILSTLRGANPRKIVFIEVRETRVNAQGEFVDPWGTPYRFDLSKPDAPRVWSCGPNRKDENGAEGSDDIVSWR